MSVLLAKNLRLREISVVGIPANDDAVILNYNRSTRKMGGIASVETVDNDTELIDLSTMKLDNARLLYFNHNQLGYPIGTIDNVFLSEYNGYRALRFSATISKNKVSEDADRVHKLVSDGTFKYLSIGFLIDARGTIIEEISDAEAERYGRTTQRYLT